VLDRKLVYKRRGGGGEDVVLGGGVLLFLESAGGVRGRELLVRLLHWLVICLWKRHSQTYRLLRFRISAWE
jgi:hypothetical protein